jgi:cobalt-zinc-cadmium efflux system protein
VAADRGRQATRRLGLVLAITALYAGAEVIGGWLANSLALLADAGHMLTDILALSLALVAAWTARRPPDPSRTYGYERVEILAALFNGVALIVIALFILSEAWERLWNPPDVGFGIVALVGTGGLVVNLIAARILHHHRDGLNLRAAYLHVLGDLLGSVGTLVAAGLMAAFGWFWADPAIGVVIAAIIVFGAVRLALESVHVLLEGAPSHIDTRHVRDCLIGLAGIGSVHDLHLWSLCGGSPLLSAHLVLDHSLPADSVLREATALLEARFGITHATLQLEPADFNIVGTLTEKGDRSILSTK